MGFLRLFLALAVVVAHTIPHGTWPLLSGALAVKLFFAISGFYMALILSGKYRRGDKVRLRVFYTNRALRIFPLMWLVLAVEVLLALGSHLAGASWAVWPSLLGRLMDAGNVAAVASLALAQISGFGVDIAHLFSFDVGGQAHLYSGPVADGGFRGWRPLPMSHAWSISCELVFYLLAPWLVRLRVPALIAVALGSSLLEPVLSRGLGLRHLADVASSFAAPLQMGFFVLGILAYRLYSHPRWTPCAFPAPLRFSVIAAFTALCMFHSYWDSISYLGTQLLLFASAWVAIPLLFHSCGRLSVDESFGSLSYPIYLIHVSVISLFDLPAVAAFTGPRFHHGTLAHACGVALVSIFLSWLLVRFVDRRIDVWRQRQLSEARN